MQKRLLVKLQGTFAPFLQIFLRKLSQKKKYFCENFAKKTIFTKTFPMFHMLLSSFAFCVINLEKN
jgi:hypothetical protein